MSVGIGTVDKVGNSGTSSTSSSSSLSTVSSIANSINASSSLSSLSSYSSPSWVSTENSDTGLVFLVFRFLNVGLLLDNKRDFGRIVFLDPYNTVNNGDDDDDDDDDDGSLFIQFKSCRGWDTREVVLVFGIVKPFDIGTSQQPRISAVLTKITTNTSYVDGTLLFPLRIILHNIYMAVFCMEHTFIQHMIFEIGFKRQTSIFFVGRVGITKAPVRPWLDIELIDTIVSHKTNIF